MFEYRCSSIHWKPSPVVALAASPNDSQVAAAREDGSLEVWLVSPGAVGWHCQLTIHGDPKSRISYLAWYRGGCKGRPSTRLFSSSIDGTISEWDLFNLKQKIVLESIGVSIWQIAVAPTFNTEVKEVELIHSGYLTEKSDDDEESGIEDLDEFAEKSEGRDRHLAAACDDGCVRIYYISDSNELMYYRSLPRVSGRVLSVAWSSDAQRIFSGSSDGLIRCWDANRCQEVYRITVGVGGLGCVSELCVWSLLSMRCGVLVSGDSSGGVRFWDSQHGTLLAAHSNHKGDVNALAASPRHNQVFSAGADGQVVLYKLSGATQKWDYIGYVRAHTHDIRALTVAMPSSCEDSLSDEILPESNAKATSPKRRRKEKPDGFTYHKWANLGVPMLISAGDDAKLFAYSVQEFTKFSPHDICPAPQRVQMQMVHNSVFPQTSLLLVQDACSLDILRIQINSDSNGRVLTKPLVRVKSKDSRKITCSAISNTGSLFAYSDQIRPRLFELKKKKLGKNPWSASRRQLPKLPFAHSMIFSSDSSRLIIAGHDRRIHTIDASSMELLHTFTPRQKGQEDESPPKEPPVTKLYSSLDGQWLAAINCFGDIYIFNLETQRQHWFISRLDGASVAAAGFNPKNNNVLVISTSSSQVFALDVEARQLTNWSLLHTLPKKYKEFPGEVIGLSFSPSPSSSSVIIYSSRGKCFIDLEKPMEQDEETALACDNVANGIEGKLGKKIGFKLGNANRKRRLDKSDEIERNKFEMVTSKNPILYLGHLSKNEILVIEKPWMEVIKSLDTQPVHKHIFGT